MAKERNEWQFAGSAREGEAFEIGELTFGSRAGRSWRGRKRTSMIPCMDRVSSFAFFTYRTMIGKSNSQRENCHQVSGDSIRGPNAISFP